MSLQQLLRQQSATPLVGAASNHHEDESLAPAHPYPGWQPTGAGDPNALLAWIDHDLKGHDAVLDAPPRPLRGEPEKAEFAKPVKTGMKIADDVAVAKDVAESVRWTQRLSGVRAVSESLAPVLGPLGMASGAMDIAEGIGECRDGHAGDGIVDMFAGALGTASSGAGMASLVLEGLGTPALGLGAFSDGMKIGHYGDHAVKDLGWFHGENGKQTASEWAGSEARSVREWFAERGHPILGQIAGAGALPATIVAAAGASLVGTGTSIGRGVAHRRNVNRMLGYSGMDLSRETAEGVVDYEEQRLAAVERFKREHPERFGHNPNNPTDVQAFAHLMQLASGTGETK